jgi:translation initiation factor 3 subunit C
LFLCDSILNYIKEFNDYPKAARIAILKLEHLHYKNDSLYQKFRECQPHSKESYIIEGDSKPYIDELVNLVSNYGTAKMKLRATLYQIYHYSIHKKYYEAKDLLLKTHIVDVIHLQDIGSQILYNRAIT